MGCCGLLTRKGSLLTITITLLGMLTMCGPAVGASEVCVNDDTGARICLSQPAKRIITLSPGATELAYAAGAGQQVVATVKYSNYPQEARQLPSVGSGMSVNLERLLSFKPDLVIAWQSGNSQEQLQFLKQFGIPVVALEPKRLDDVSSALERLGALSGHSRQGKQQALLFNEGIDKLRQQYAHRTLVRIFYEVWDSPLITINGQQLINQVIDLCGGHNIYANLTPSAPHIGKEALLADNPDAIVSGGMGEENDNWINEWKRYPQLSATSHHNLIFIPPDLLQRPTPRLLEGARTLCTQLDSARQRLSGKE